MYKTQKSVNQFFKLSTQFSKVYACYMWNQSMRDIIEKMQDG